MDVWTTFWSTLLGLAMSGEVVSSVKVKDEIAQGFDELSDWIKNHVPKEFFLPIVYQDIVIYSQLQHWASSRVFTEVAKTELATNADAYIIASAYSKGLTLVTFEKSNPQRKNKVMISDTCPVINANCCEVNAMLRAEENPHRRPENDCHWAAMWKECLCHNPITFL